MTPTRTHTREAITDDSFNVKIMAIVLLLGGVPSLSITVDSPRYVLGSFGWNGVTTILVHRTRSSVFDGTGTSNADLVAAMEKNLPLALSD